MGEMKKKKKKDNNPTVWFSLRKSLHCESEPSDVRNPTTKKQLVSILTRKTGRRLGCSRSIPNLKHLIHGGSKTHMERPRNCSPRSIGSSEFVIMSNFGGFSGGGSTFVGTLRPGTPGPTMHRHNPSSGNPVINPAFRKMTERVRRAEMSFKKDDRLSSGVSCRKWEALESHHLSKHAAVTELVEGDSSRKIVEIICRSSFLKSDNHCFRIDRILKVHNIQNTLLRFEEYRETVKVKASKLSKKHPRCSADGNELLRFHGTTLACSLGSNGPSIICVSDRCSVCRIIRHGFSMEMELKPREGVFTTSTSGRAFESIQVFGDDPMLRKALIVCRVIAGRVHRPLENVQEMVGQIGFDSLAGKVGLYSNIEELYLLNAKALLPCFVVICKV